MNSNCFVLLLLTTLSIFFTPTNSGGAILSFRLSSPEAASLKCQPCRVSSWRVGYQKVKSSLYYQFKISWKLTGWIAPAAQNYDYYCIFIIEFPYNKCLAFQFKEIDKYGSHKVCLTHFQESKIYAIFSQSKKYWIYLAASFTSSLKSGLKSSL